MSTRMHDLMARAREELRYEPTAKRVRARLGGETIVDSTRAVLVWEPGRICPVYAVPEEEIRAELSPAPPETTNGEVPPVLHPGIPFSVHTAAGEPLSIGDRTGAGYRLDDEALAGLVVMDFDAFEWYEEDEPVTGHPRDPFHRVDVRRSARHIRVELDGEVVADTTRARLLFETSLPVRFYLPREDIRAELRPSELRTYCPYKGQASYWSSDGAQDLFWTYEHPLPDAAEIAGLVAFWDERFEVYVDGERRERSDVGLAKAMRDEFGV